MLELEKTFDIDETSKERLYKGGIEHLDIKLNENQKKNIKELNKIKITQEALNYKDFNFEEAGLSARKIILVGFAFHLGIFETLIKEYDYESLAKELHLDSRALWIILEALCALNLIKKHNHNKYIISKKAKALFINHKSKEYIGDSLPHLMNILTNWMKLPQIVKSGRPAQIIHSSKGLFDFIKAMNARPDDLINEVVEICLKRKKDAFSLLDLGGGPGKFAEAFLKKIKSVVLFDTPNVIEIVKNKFGLDKIKRLRLIGGDFTRPGFIKKFNTNFDIIFMGNITHSLSPEENQILFNKARKIINPGGLIAILDFARGRSPMAELFAVNMLVNTLHGGTWTEEQYKKWLLENKFTDIKINDLIDKKSQLITAIYSP